VPYLVTNIFFQEYAGPQIIKDLRNGQKLALRLLVFNESYQKEREVPAQKSVAWVYEARKKRVFFLAESSFHSNC